MDLLKSFKLLSLLFIFSALAACGASDGDSSGSSTGTGQVSILITDAVNEDFDEVNLTVTSISFLGEGDGHETIVFDESKVINLLALQNYSDWLVTTVIPAGIYDKIRFHVTRVELVKQGQDPIITKLPANGKVDLNPRGTFEIITGGHLMIELDVDAEKSIHIIETGNGKKYNFRPVVFVTILGAEGDESKLVLLDGKVLARSAAGFQLCDVEVVEVNDSCLAVLISENTVVQDDLIEVVSAGSIEDGDIVTVLGRAGSQEVGALHIVIEAVDKAVSNLALFSGAATSDFDVDHFTMNATTDDVVIQPIALTALTVALIEGSGVRVFDKRGNQVSADAILTGMHVDAFGLAQPGIESVSKVKAAFVIIDNTAKAEKISGTIAAVNDVGSEITITVVNEVFSGDVCVDVKDAIIFILAVVDNKVVTREITINELRTDMHIDAYGQDDGLSCFAADVVLVAEPLPIAAPVGATLLVTGQ